MTALGTACLLTSLMALAMNQLPAAEAPSAPVPAPREEVMTKAAADIAAASERIADALEKLAARETAELKPGPAEVKPAPAAVPVAAAKTKPPVGWTGSFGLGFISLTGNASTLTVSGNASAERKSEDWIYALKANGAYGQARLTEGAEPSVTALAGTVQLRGDRRFTQVISAFLLGGAETDHIKSIELRTYGEGGSGIIWLERSEGKLERAFFRTDLALRVGREYRFQYYPTPLDLEDIPIVAPRFGLTFRYALSEDVRFIEQAEVLPNLIGNRSLMFSSTSKLTARIAEPISLGVGFRVDYDSQPAPGKVTTDTQLTVGIEVGF